MRLLIAACIVVMSSSAMAAECVQVTLRDVNGLAIKTDKPLVGFVMPEGAPLLDYAIVAGSQIEAGTSVSCPVELIAAMTSLFNESCTTDAQRAATVKANNTTPENVNKRCKDIYMRLHSKP
jgi:hypothetical protein